MLKHASFSVAEPIKLAVWPDEDSAWLAVLAEVES